MTFNLGFSSASIQRATAFVRSYGAVVIIGAGVSAGAFPMTPQLPPLLWQGIDASSGASRALRERIGRTGSAKQLIGEDPTRLGLGWHLLRDFNDARGTFQDAFAALDLSRRPSQAHRDLARMVHDGRVELVISFNWDTCLERAHQDQFGVPIPPDVLYKPHGDAARPDLSWVLPDEPGVVTQDVLSRIQGMQDRSRTLLVMGYSGSDERVVEVLLGPLGARWPVVRVGPTATGPDAVAGYADEVLSAIADRLATGAFVPGWRPVTFERRRSLAAVLRGERLRPNDVDACPELPAAARIADRLGTTKFATLSGGSGTGKSITAFHAARRMNRDYGWSVLELAQAGVATMSEVDAFRALPGPVLAVVDDAQAIELGVRAALADSADESHAVLLVSTERLEPRLDETLLPKQATRALYEYCLNHIDEVAPILTELDDRVRKSAFFETPKQRLDLAMRTSNEPWVFMFVASGGERRITGALDRAVENVHTAMVLTMVSIAQMITRDAGATRAELVNMLRTYAPTDFTESAAGVQLDEALDRLRDERLLSDDGGRIRAAHVRIAERAIWDLVTRNEHGIGALVVDTVRSSLLDPTVALAGKFWILNSIHNVERWQAGLNTIFRDGSVVDELVRECIEADPGPERGVGLNVVWIADRVRAIDEDVIDRLADRVVEWIPALKADEVNGMRWIMSCLRSSHKATFERVKAAVGPGDLGASLSRGGNRHRAMDWSHLLSELAPQWPAFEAPEWQQEFTAGVDVNQLGSWLLDRDEHSRPFQIYDLIDTLTRLAPEIAKTTFGFCAPEIVHAMETDLAGASANFSDWVFGVMMVVARLADAPTAEDLDDDEITEPESAESAERRATLEAQLRPMSELVLQAFSNADWEQAARSLVGKEPYEVAHLDVVLAWLGTLSTAIPDRLATSVPADWLIDLSREEGSFELTGRLLHYLAVGRDGREAVRRILEAHDAEIDEFPWVLISDYPDIAAQMILQGRRVGAYAPRPGGWTRITADTNLIGGVSSTAAAMYLRMQQSAIAEGITNPQAHDLRGIDCFIELADGLDTDLLEDVLGEADFDSTSQVWAKRSVDAFEAFDPLLSRAAGTDSPLGLYARGLSQADRAEDSRRDKANR